MLGGSRYNEVSTCERGVSIHLSEVNCVSEVSRGWVQMLKRCAVIVTG